MGKENFKTAILILLFVVSVTLTQQLWIVLPIGQVITADKPSPESINTDVIDILSPQSFVINFGGSNHTVFFSEPYEIWNITNPDSKEKIWIWKTAKATLRDYFKEDYTIEEIKAEDWKNINNFKSLRMDFACELPSSSLIDLLANNKNISNKNIGSIDSIIIPAIESEKTNIYMGNFRQGKYVRLKGNLISNKVKQLIDNIEIVGEEKGYVSYYSLQDYTPVNSDILTPIFDEVNIPKIKVTNEIQVSDKAQVKTIANEFFGNDFDFVKEITETDGTVIYMYGYGEKALKIEKGGLLEHIEKVNNDRPQQNLDFTKSLQIATQFVKEHVGWPVNLQNAYLSDYEKGEKENKKGYRFFFNYRLNGLPVYVPHIGKLNAIEVEVVGNQVTYYKRLVKRISEKYSEDKKVTLIAEVIVNNLDLIKKNYLNNNFNNNLDDKDINYLKILELIRELELAYYYNGKVLIPVWKVVIDNTVYYFDLYNGDLVYSYQD
ncbi:MAG: hypothetical protein PWQ37_196 [Candidatus Petromonas sp.]|jgi:regulatory protein YycH of two-component signal transduction system YycFG|nr:hypothetical protein [Candidatus Petromonas sp.]